jgi:predicted amidophosphoribosyltransferase
VRAEPLPALRRSRGTRDSAGLDAGERRRNLAGRFRCRPLPGGALPAGVVVLVDDVVTSGATLTEAARTLAALRVVRSGGVRPVVAAVVAATPRRPPRDDLRDRPAAVFTVRS